MGRECKERAPVRGVLSPGDKYKSWATRPQQLPPQKEHTLTLHLLGTAIRATFPVPGIGPGPLHQRQAEGGHHGRPSLEAASTARPPVAEGPTTASNPEEEPPNLQGGSRGCRGLAALQGSPPEAPGPQGWAAVQCLTPPGFSFS